MYPIRFEPFFQRYLWGGRRLGETLNKPIGKESAAESWEVVDHRDGNSVVASGPWAGKTLHELVVEYDEDIVGARVWNQINDNSLAPNLRLRFPLLLKFLDAARNLSVQVHPDDRLGAKLNPPDLGKTEAWYVMDAQPGATIYAGLKQHVSKSQFSDAIKTGAVEEVLNSFEANPGDCVFIEAGTLHAIGAGVLIAEIQQASNTTYRVFDWNRVDKDGRPRPLHIDAAIEATHFDRGPVFPVEPIEAGQGRATLVECEQFRMERWRIGSAGGSTIGEPTSVRCDGEFKIVTCVRGEVVIVDDPNEPLLKLGETTLLPASLCDVELTAASDDAEVLVISC